jgi:hypothetical protein
MPCSSARPAGSLPLAISIGAAILRTTATYETPRDSRQPHARQGAPKRHLSGRSRFEDQTPRSTPGPSNLSDVDLKRAATGIL